MTVIIVVLAPEAVKMKVITVPFTSAGERFRLYTPCPTSVGEFTVFTIAAPSILTSPDTVNPVCGPPVPLYIGKVNPDSAVFRLIVN
jgi:hypothetical protein